MIIALNNKCNFTHEEFLEYQERLKSLSIGSNEVILFPPMVYLSEVTPYNMLLGSQNVSKFETGQHTGEISASQLKSINVSYCLVGHYERRSEQKENERDINLKIKNLLSEDIVPILCVGETRLERETGKTNLVIERERLVSFVDVSPEQLSRVIIAYEPNWVIGNGETLSQEELEETILHIKKLFPNNKILYGGSINEETIANIDKRLPIDGYLIGNLSLYPDLLQRIFNKIEN